MIDYINILNSIDNKLSNITLEDMINHYFLPVILPVACILSIILILMIIIVQINPNLCAPIFLLLIICFTFIAAINKPTNKQPDSTDLLKYLSKNLQQNEIYEAIDINNAVDANNILNKIKQNDNTNQNEFTIKALLKGGNINSLNNFYLNIIYLDNYYKNNYTEKSEYEWINEILNEFYHADITENTNKTDILKNLKN